MLFANNFRMTIQTGNDHMHVFQFLRPKVAQKQSEPLMFPNIATLHSMQFTE